MNNTDLKNRLQAFLDNEAKSCSMDYGSVTPLYVYRMWGGCVSIDEIATGLTELRKQGMMESEPNELQILNEI